ncbi:virion core protein (lumpy skin disease virus) [Fibrisoma montanum]|uniref:Virion core protein (Lumpy skin disease virus) n=1 Tax=Fibrisoma montanum TaxID=2305895 RepID=A0A418MCH5_9BACT|nr:SPFH domain-containing protein [Fibrisoma montanum]RIV24065.1 virion core protein (lumpy skin disease virus) [Fibrisoma montanum]
MGLFDFIRNELIEVIDWVDNSTDTVIWKFPDNGNNIKYGAQLTVRESQVAVFMNEGQIADVYPPGRYELTTQNMPIMTTLRSWKFGFESPFKADVYFVSTKQFTNLKWGTQNPIIVRDPEFKQVRVRAFGVFSLRVTDGGKFIKEFAGTTPIVRIADVEDQLRTAIVSKFSDTVAEANVSILDLARNYQELGEKLRPMLQDDFTAYGLELTRFYIENTSLPPEVEAFLDKTTQMNMVGDMARFQQFQAGMALEDAAENGGAAGTAILMGGLGNFMNNANAANAPQPAAAPKEDKAQVLELLKQLGELKAAGVLTEEEFTAKKAELLARL